MTVEAIIEFWFGSNRDDSAMAKEKSPLWWSKDPRTDDEIRRRFAGLAAQAAAGDLSDWRMTPHGRLALILLTDQFPRNIYRDTAKAFAHDHQALAECLDGIAREEDLKLRPIERVFFYLPLEHSESLEHQEQAVKRFGALRDAVGAHQKDVFAEYLDFAVRHRDIIARFGRFPHRNKILGRESTPDELAFLAEPGSSF